MTAPWHRASSDPTPAVYTLPPGEPILDRLAESLLAETATAPADLAQYTVLLPTRRACVAMRDALLRVSEGRPLLAPRIAPLGDIDGDGDEDVAVADTLTSDGMDLAPAMPPLRRRMLLARTILARGDIELTPDQAVTLAGDLASLIDRVQTERLDFDRLRDLVPDELAEHWQRTLAFLSIVTEHWPMVRQAEGAMDPADRRDRLMTTLADRWRRSPPVAPVIAAGSTGSIPATADLLAVVAHMEHGAVLLPGLDRDIDDESWATLDEGHPQAGLKRLLKVIDIDRHAVRIWPTGRPRLPDRSALVREVMRPATTTDAWQDLASLTQRTVDGLTVVTCPTERNEATTVALAMRAALETPGKTCALVTADRALARRVAAELRRWRLTVDDSAGRPLAHASAAIFLRLVADAVAENVRPISLLALLKHPLAAAGRPPAACRALVRELELAALRGPRPSAGWGGIRDVLNRTEGADALAGLVDDLARDLAPVTDLGHRPAAPRELLDAHLLAAEALARTDAEPGRDRLWSGDENGQLAAFLEDLRVAVDDMPEMSPASFGPWFLATMAGEVVRPRFGRHPRLFIWGTLEARLQSADRLILGGLNEGQWPSDPGADPWMSRPMAAQFGLPPPERRIGLAAHDFAQAIAAPDVMITRAARVEGAPAVPSRWLSRLDAVLQGAGLAVDEAPHWLEWARQLDEPETVEARPAPAPRPSLDRRPRRLSVTEVGTLLANPYQVYARRVLRLDPLDPLEESPGAAERGSVIHDALDQAIHKGFDPWSAGALDHVLRCGRDAFGAWFAHPAIRQFWWPRFERVARWFVETERHRQPGFQPQKTETGGKLRIPVRPDYAVDLSGRADRIDSDGAGAIAIIDYKTGSAPSQKQVDAGFAPQLPLEAIMLKAGAFGSVTVNEVAELAYWRLSGGAPAGKITLLKDPVDLVASTEAGLRRLLDRYGDPAMPFRCRLPPSGVPRYADYDHLARLGEWGGSGEGDP